MSYLLVANGEFTLRFLVRLRVLIESLDCVIVEHFFRKLDVAFGVLVTGENLGIIWKGGQGLVQSFMHLLRSSLEETSTSADEHRVSGEYSTILAILEEEADTVLGVAGSVQCRNFNGTDLEFGLMTWCLCNKRTITAANYGKVELLGLCR